MSMENGRLSVEWPDTQHPAFDSIAGGVRSAIASRNHHGYIQYAHQSQPLVANFHAQTDAEVIESPFETRTLTIHRACGPAPYVGRPFVYMWEVAADNFGRWVAGPSRIEYLPDSVYWESIADSK